MRGDEGVGQTLFFPNRACSGASSSSPSQLSAAEEAPGFLGNCWAWGCCEWEGWGSPEQGLFRQLTAQPVSVGIHHLASFKTFSKRRVMLIWHQGTSFPSGRSYGVGFAEQGALISAGHPCL